MIVIKPLPLIAYSEYKLKDFFQIKSHYGQFLGYLLLTGYK